MERLDVYLCGQLVGALVRDGVRAELPALLDQENASHPAAIYHDIAQGIHRRLSQL